LRTAALVQLYAASFGSSAAAYDLTKLLLFWNGNRQCLPSVAVYAFLNSVYAIV
jgi:hypothetical protein